MSIEKIFAFFIPHDLNKDTVKLAHARNFVGSGVVSMFAAPCFMIFYFFLVNIQAVFAILAAELVILLALFILKGTSSLLLAGNMMLCALASILWWLTYYLGGLYAAPSYWFVLLPLVAVFMGGMVLGYVWCFISLFIITIMYVLQYLHATFPSTVVINPLLLQWISISGLLLIVMALVHFYDFGKKVTLAKLRYIAYHDALTNLPNRTAYEEAFEEFRDKAKKENTSFAVLYLNIDHFKKINNAFGQMVGDLLLKEVVLRVKRHIRHTDMMARVGNDEFKILIEGKKSMTEIKQMAEVILTSLKTPYHIKTDEFSVTASMGAVMYPLNQAHDKFVNRAVDLALFKAKEIGGDSIQFFTESLAAEETLRIDIEKNLPSALSNQEMSLNFQPQFDVCNPTKITGIEALLRWNCSKLPDVPSSLFIPIAEKIGMISELGEWVLKEACLQYMAWQRLGLVDEKIHLSVNISAHQLYKENFLNHVESVLASTGISPRHVEFELTETAVLTDESYAINIIQKLNQMGVHTVIDDFGIGYTSLSYLITLPVSGLKIDKLFIDDIVNKNNSPIIIAAMIDLAHRINLTVVAEGVESAEQLDYLQKINCDYAQGFFLSKPLDAQMMEALLKKSLMLS